jgi:hypothetical protein
MSATRPRSLLSAAAQHAAACSAAAAGELWLHQGACCKPGRTYRATAKPHAGHIRPPRARSLPIDCGERMHGEWTELRGKGPAAQYHNNDKRRGVSGRLGARVKRSWHKTGTLGSAPWEGTVELVDLPRTHNAMQPQSIMQPHGARASVGRCGAVGRQAHCHAQSVRVAKQAQCAPSCSSPH